MRLLDPNMPGLQDEYQSALGAEKIRLTRAIIVLATCLNCVFSVLDYFALSSAFEAAWALRGSAMLVVGAGFVSTWHPQFLRYYPAITAGMFLTMGLSINGIILLAEPTDVAHDSYYGGLMLLTYALYGLTYLPLTLPLIVSGTLIGCYLFTARDVDAVVLATNLCFFVSTTLLGIVSLRVRERYSQETFLLRRSLQEDVARKHEAAKRAEHLAEHDALTGLPNRLRFQKDASHTLAQAAQHGAQVAVLFIDLDGFKPINDQRGHAAGDRVLSVVAKRLLEALRTEDIVARIGGDEFVACITIDDARPATVQAIIRHLTQRLQDSIDAREGALAITASIGVAVYPEDGTDLKTLLQRADEDMYRIKSARRASAPHYMPLPQL